MDRKWSTFKFHVSLYKLFKKCQPLGQNNCLQKHGNIGIRSVTSDHQGEYSPIIKDCCRCYWLAFFNSLTRSHRLVILRKDTSFLYFKRHVSTVLLLSSVEKNTKYKGEFIMHTECSLNMYWFFDLKLFCKFLNKWAVSSLI